MRRLTLLKITLLSFLGSSLLCVLAFLTLRTVDASSGFSHQHELALRIAKEFETGSITESLQAYSQRHAQTPFARTQIWAIDSHDQVIGATTPDPLPFEWGESCRPTTIHDIAVHYSFLSVSPDFTCIRLETAEPNYLVIHLAPRRPSRALWGTSFMFIFLTVAIAVFLSLTLTFFYLQRKSREAKEILSNIQKGDLEARFQIQQFDEIGSLMLDFNRMADALQALVLRLRNVENSRRNLLRELSHDIRTPLTSLKTSLETLRQESPLLKPEDRKEFFVLAEAELNYLGRLFEDLFFMADLDEPRFKVNTESPDVVAILKSEIKNRQQRSPQMDWQLEIQAPPNSLRMAGDEHMIQRLFKNALDNAGRFAKSRVYVFVKQNEDHIDIQIDDDGNGLSPVDQENFGHRRLSRAQPAPGSSHLSLGLGSVIMKSIAELHGGSIEIHNILENGRIIGARLRILLHK